MADKKKSTVPVTLECTECKNRNYTVYKNKKQHKERLSFNKYCKKDRRHTLHKETK